jgi:hypothetical protein
VLLERLLVLLRTSKPPLPVGAHPRHPTARRGSDSYGTARSKLRARPLTLRRAASITRTGAVTSSTVLRAALARVVHRSWAPAPNGGCWQVAG